MSCDDFSDKCIGSSRFVILIFSIVLILISLGIITFVCVLLFVQNIDDLSEIVNSRTVTSLGIFLLVTLTVLFMVSILGICGSVRKSGHILKAFAFFLTILTILELVGASYYMAYSNSVEKVLKGEMRKSMRLYRGENSSWADSVAWNLLQLQHDCCGVNNKSDWIGTPWQTGTPSVNAYIQQYPFTCCKISNEPSIKSIRKGNIEPSTSDVDNCYEGANPTGLRRQGCYKALRKVLSDYGVIIGLCLFGLLSLQLLLVYLSCQIATKHKSGNAFWFSQKLPEDQD